MASTLNPEPGMVLANEIVAKVGSDGQVEVYNRNGTVDLLFDVVGYLPAESEYVPLTPSRVLDTRDGTGSVKAPLGARERRSVQVTGVGGVPSSGVGAVVLNVTAVNATRTGYVTVWPAGVERPLASTLNPEPGMVLANEIVAKVGSDGRVEVYNRNGTVDLIFDVVGYLPSSDA